MAPGSPSASPSSSSYTVSRQRSAWLRMLLSVHWISSAVCLFGLIIFALTGVTLNHAGQIESRPAIVRLADTLPASLLTGLRRQATSPQPQALSEACMQWLHARFGLTGLDGVAEWSADEVYLALPRPGGDAWLRIGLMDGEVEYERTDRGWIAWLNDLHKGRHTGAAWRAFIDLLAVGCLLFALSGLLILKIHAAQRGLTWPLLGLGVLLPALLVLLFIH